MTSIITELGTFENNNATESLFHSNYIETEPFYKKYDKIQELKIKWNENITIDIPNNIHYLGNNYVKIKIPYFQMFKENIIKSNVSTQNNVINKILYDNHLTYLFLNNNKYYLIPEFILKNNINYKLNKINFKKIDKYFDDIISYNISGDTDIFFASFNNIKYISTILPLFMTFSNNYDKYYLNLLNNNLENKQYHQSLLLPNSFDNYMENKIKSFLFTHYQHINHYDDLTKYHNIINNEIEYLFNNFINNSDLNIVNIDINNFEFLSNIKNNLNDSIIISNNDCYKSYLFYNNNSFNKDLLQFIIDTIVKNSLVLQYTLLNLYSEKQNTITYYKKYNIVEIENEYKFILSNLNNNGINYIQNINNYTTSYTSWIKKYYPEWTLVNDSNGEPLINQLLPFKISTNMTIRTEDHIQGIITKSGDYYKIILDDPTGNYLQLEIALFFTTDNTENEPIADFIINDNHNSNNFNNNIKNNLYNLEYDDNNNVPLFYSVKEGYYLSENIISSIFNKLKLTSEQIKELYIELQVYKDRFNSTDESLEINYIDGDGSDFYEDKKYYIDNYKYLYNINEYPQDLYNIYLLCLREFIEDIKSNDIFYNKTFIRFLHNKFVSYFFYRHFKYPQLNSSVYSNFKGHLFYYNIDTQLMMTKNYIKESIHELFNKRHFIGYFAIDNNMLSECKIRSVTAYGYHSNNNLSIGSTYNERDETDAFHNYKNVTEYDILIKNTIITNTSIKILKSKFNYYYFKETLTKFSLLYNNKNYNINKYELNDQYLVLYINMSNIFNNNILNFTLKEVTIIQIPLYYHHNRNEVNIGKRNNTNRYILYDKHKNINNFIDNKKIYYSGPIIDNVYDKMYLTTKYNNPNYTIIKLTYIITQPDVQYIWDSNYRENKYYISKQIAQKLNLNINIIEVIRLINNTVFNNNYVEYYVKINKKINPSLIKNIYAIIKYKPHVGRAIYIEELEQNIEEIIDDIETREVVLSENGIYYDLSNINILIDLKINIEKYDEICLDIIKLPITEIIINSLTNCEYSLLHSFPYLYLSKTSLAYTNNISILKTTNTYKINSNNSYKYNCKIEDITTNYIKFIIINNDIGDLNIENLTLQVFDNTYYPNMAYYGSLTNAYTSLIITDYFYQKPMLIKMQTQDNNIPLYVFHNVIDNSKTEYFSTQYSYLNNKLIYNLYDSNSEQILRDVDYYTSTGIFKSRPNEIHSAVFDIVNLNNLNYINNIETIIINKFNKYFSGWKGYIIDNIENINYEYTKIYLSKLFQLNNTIDYGSTVSQIYKNCIKLNKYITGGYFETYTLDFENFNLIDFDIYSPININLYSYTDHNGFTFETEFSILEILLKRTNRSKQKITRLPWASYYSKIKISNNVHKYLENTSTFIKNQIKYCINNLSINKIVNSQNNNNNIIIQDEMNHNYVKKLYNINKTKIDLYTSNPFLDLSIDNYFNLSHTDITFDHYYENKKINIEYSQININNTIENTILTNDDISYFNSNNHFIESQIQKSKYDILGYIKVKDNKILLENKYNEDINIIVINNHVLYYRLSDNNYQYYVQGTPTSDFNKGINGIYYPLSIKNSGNDIEMTFLTNNNTLENITFYMPRNNYNYAIESSSVPEQYINYEDINSFNFLELNGIHSNVLSLTPTINIKEYLCTVYNTFFYNKISCDNLNLYFNTTDNYYIKINNIICYGKFNGSYLEILSTKQLLLNNSINIYLKLTLDDNNIIINNIKNKILFGNINNFTFISYFNILNLNIIKSNNYNIYISDVLTYTNYIVNTSYDYYSDGSIKLTKEQIPEQDYNDNIYLLGYTFLKVPYYTQNIIDMPLSIIQVQSSLLPPLIVENQNINIYNPLSDVNFIENENRWLCVNNIEFQVKDINNITIADGNYLLYYSNNNNKPDTIIYSDLYINKKLYTTTVYYDPYHNTITINNINIPIDINQIIELNNIKYNILKVIYNTSNIIVYCSDKPYIYTDININVGLIQYKRPIVITNIETYYNYGFYNNDETIEYDSMYILPTSSVSSTSIFLRKLVFSSVHTSNILNVICGNSYVNITKNSNLIWSINIITTDTLETDTIYDIIFDVYRTTIDGIINREQIILHFIISNIYMTSCLLVDGNYMNEPLYLNISSNKIISINGGIHTFNSIDSTYFTYNTNNLITKTQINLTSFILYDKGVSTFGELNNITSNDYIVSNDWLIKTNTNKFIKSNLNIWEYFGNVIINSVGNNSVLIDSELINYIKYNYLPLIFINNDNLYYRNIINITNNNNNYYITLDNPLNFTNADLYIYPFTGIFINKSFSFNLIDDTMYIYTDSTQLERGEIIKINNYIVIVNYFSDYYNSFICKLISSNITNNLQEFNLFYTNTTNIYNHYKTNYLSFGKISNYYNYNKNLINDNYIKYNFELKKYTTMIDGDFYIENYNTAKYYDRNNQPLDEKIFSLQKGSYINIMYNNGNWYYDINRIKLEIGMRLVYEINTDAIPPSPNVYNFIITNINKNIITFENNFQIWSNIIINVYVPINPFIQQRIIINNNICNDIDNGFINISGSIYKVTNNKTTSINYSGITGVFDFNNINLYTDFTNSFQLNDENSTELDKFSSFAYNEEIGIKMKLSINSDEDYIYFTNNFDYNFLNLKYYFYQNILVDNVIFKVIKIINNKLYINKTIVQFPLVIKNYYEVIFSAGNVNNIHLNSNNMRLSNNFFYNYPNIKYTNLNNDIIPINFNLLFYNNINNMDIGYVDNLVDKYNYNMKYTYVTKSSRLIELKNNSTLWDNTNKKFYIENYVRLNETNNGSSIGSDSFSIYLTVEDLNTFITDNIIIEEISDHNTRFIHYVDIEIINNMIKIKSNNKFENIIRSTFYLHRIIPIRITNNNYILLLPVKPILNREINTNRKELIYIIYGNVQFLNKPEYIQSIQKWKYKIGLTSEVFQLFKHQKLYNNNDIYELDETTYTINLTSINSVYIYGNKLIEIPISKLSIHKTFPIKKISYYDKNIKLNNELNSVFDKDIYNQYKIINNLNLTQENNNYFLSFKNNNNTNVTFNIFDDKYYLNNTNNITSININNDKYKITTKDELSDLKYDINEKYQYYYYNDIKYTIDNKGKNYQLYRYFNNTNNYYYCPNKEISSSIPTYFKILNNNQMNMNVITNNIKPWANWSMLSLYNSNLVQYINNISIQFNGTSIIKQVTTNSYFTDDEIIYIETFLKNTYSIKDNYYSLLLELQQLEIFIFEQLTDLINQERFWNNIDNIIKNISESWKITNKITNISTSINIDYYKYVNEIISFYSTDFNIIKKAIYDYILDDNNINLFLTLYPPDLWMGDITSFNNQIISLASNYNIILGDINFSNFFNTIYSYYTILLNDFIASGIINYLFNNDKENFILMCPPDNYNGILTYSDQLTQLMITYGIIEENSSVITDTYWTFYNGDLRKYINGVLENDSLFNNDGSRKYYLPFDITINNNNIVTISRNIITINNEFSNFINNGNATLNGINIHQIIKYIKELKLYKLSIDNNYNDLFNHKYNNGLKFLINKNFNTFINDTDNELNKLNNNFYNLHLSNNINKYNTYGDTSDFLFNYYEYRLFNNEFQDNINTIDSYYLINIYKRNRFFYDKQKNNNSIISDNLYNINIKFDDNTHDSIDNSNDIIIDNINANDITISKTYIYSNSIQFYTNEIITDNISVIVNNKYNIIEYNNIGQLYNITIDTTAKISTDSELYYNNEKIIVNSIIPSNNLINITVVSNNISEDNKIIKTIDLFKFKSVKFENNKTIFDNLKDYSQYIFLAESTNTFILFENELYEVFEDDINNMFYINSRLNIRKNRLYRIIRFFDILTITNKYLYLSHIIVDKEINIKDFNKNIYSNDLLNIISVKIIKNKIFEIYHSKNNNPISTELIQQYRIRQSEYFEINKIISQKKYLYLLNYNFTGKNKNNFIITFDNYNGGINSITKTYTNIYINNDYDKTEINNIILLIKYQYLLHNITYYDTYITITIPNDFIFNKDNTYYINNNIVNIETNNDLLYIYTTDSNINYLIEKYNLTNSIISIPQYYKLFKIEFKNEIIISDNNTIRNLSQYFSSVTESLILYTTGLFIKGNIKIIYKSGTGTEKLYTVYQLFNNNYFNKSSLIPEINIFNKNNEEFKYNYFYKINLTNSNIIFNKYIYIKNNNDFIKTEIILNQKNKNNYEIIIGSNNIITVGIIDIYTHDFLFKSSVTISEIDNIYNKAILNEQIDDNNIYILLNNSINDFNYINNITENKYILYYKFSQIYINNNSYKNIGFNTFTKTSITTTSNNIQYMDIEWVDNLTLKLFKLIEFYIDDKIIEKLDYDTMKILHSHYINKFKQEHFYKITKIKRENNDYILYLPLNFFYVKNNLPIYLLDKIKIKFHIEDIYKLINLYDYKLTKIVQPTLTYFYEYSMIPQNYLKQIQYQLIENIYPYQTIIINNNYEKIDLQLSSRVKELFIVVKHDNYNTINEYDSWYNEYLINYNKYSNGDTNVINYYIFKLVQSEINNNTKRVQIINKHPLLKEYDIKYIIYLDEKYLDHINENLNTLTTGHSLKLSILSLYFKNNYKNNIIITKPDLISSLTFEIDGIKKTPTMEQKYYNIVKPYLQGEKLDNDYLLYNISLESISKSYELNQPNGIIDFSKVQNFSIIAKTNYTGYIKIIAKEYRFLHF
jgi:hypothetical protein